MVQKNIRWNISKEKGEKIAHDNIIDILIESKNNKLLLSELIVLLNQRTKQIKLTNHRKNKQFSFYIKNVYGDMIQFLDNYSFYDLSNGLSNDPNPDKSSVHVSLIDTELVNTELTPSIINEYREWTLVDTDDFEFI
tara:strand:- start:591 stop:1001 length:411 start_codon:yes stop_codon:yes gene_type:complete